MTDIQSFTRQKDTFTAKKDDKLRNKKELEAKLADLKQQTILVEQTEEKYSKELTQIENKINQVSDILAKLNESEIHHRKWEDENILLNNTLKSLRKSLEETKK